MLKTIMRSEIIIASDNQSVNLIHPLTINPSQTVKLQQPLYPNNLTPLPKLSHKTNYLLLHSQILSS